MLSGILVLAFPIIIIGGSFEESQMKYLERPATNARHFESSSNLQVGNSWRGGGSGGMSRSWAGGRGGSGDWEPPVTKESVDVQTDPSGCLRCDSKACEPPSPELTEVITDANGRSEDLVKFITALDELCHQTARDGKIGTDQIFALTMTTLPSRRKDEAPHLTSLPPPLPPTLPAPDFKKVTSSFITTAQRPVSTGAPRGSPPPPPPPPPATRRYEKYESYHAFEPGAEVDPQRYRAYETVSAAQHHQPRHEVSYPGSPHPHTPGPGPRRHLNSGASPSYPRKPPSAVMTPDLMGFLSQTGIWSSPEVENALNNGPEHLPSIR
eukprot:NODE_2816_length_1335_cov_79.309406_g2675_i0.p1 GENE.NODE_2816_length_1335_cov_79.309406_g2675_i0~~NODE_2816_length_1335_cov_79.309406_g2675_i0.p1  ORF type:complete len:354 (-),score=48.90 NODE_2816_length_1335_cov_79.309406_g2675_i0:273-1244(-)